MELVWIIYEHSFTNIGWGEGRRYTHSCQCTKQKYGKVTTTNALAHGLIERKLLNKFSNDSLSSGASEYQ